MNSAKEDHLKVPGASLYYEIRGSGPVLLMIPGGPTDATVFAGIVPRLSDSYTVVTYDPRGLSRSKLDVLPQDQRNVEFFLAHYLRAVTGYQPDMAALLTGSTRVVAAVGEASGGQVAYRGGVELAKLLGTEVVVFPGDHGGFSTHPDEFAAMLHKVLVAG